MLKDRVINHLLNYKNLKTFIARSPAEVCSYISTIYPNHNSVILNYIDYLVKGYIAINGFDEGLNGLIDGLIDEVQSLYS